jgi:predicted amidohydrolase YtcJ
MIREPNDELEQRLPDYFMPADENDFLVVRSIKVSIDGALGPHGAWLLEPYADMPTSHGLALTPPGVRRRAPPSSPSARLPAQRPRHRRPREPRGPRHLRARVPRTRPPRPPLAHRARAAPPPADIAASPTLGVIPAMQGVHATSDGPWIPRRLGEQRAREGAYVWRELLDSGAIIANGTDAPVEDISPIMSFHSSVTRRMADGDVFHGEQRMTRDEALRSYTLSNAFAAFEETSRARSRPASSPTSSCCRRTS